MTHLPKWHDWRGQTVHDEFGPLSGPWFICQSCGARLRAPEQLNERCKGEQDTHAQRYAVIPVLPRMQ